MAGPASALPVQRWSLGRQTGRRPTCWPRGCASCQGLAFRRALARAASACVYTYILCTFTFICVCLRVVSRPLLPAPRNSSRACICWASVSRHAACHGSYTAGHPGTDQVSVGRYVQHEQWWEHATKNRGGRRHPHGEGEEMYALYINALDDHSMEGCIEGECRKTKHWKGSGNQNVGLCGSGMEDVTPGQSGLAEKARG